MKELDDLMIRMADRALAQFRGVAQDLVDAVTKRLIQDKVEDRYWPYVWWALAEQKTLPVAASQPYRMAMSLLTATGAMPQFGNALTVPEDFRVDDMLPDLSRFVLLWVNAKLIPGLSQAYRKVLMAEARNVPSASGGLVASGDAIRFLQESFPQVLGMHGAWFRHGALLRMVLKHL